MRLVIFGLTISSSWGNGHATLWRGLVRALCARGHSVSFYERNVPYYADARDGWPPPRGALLRLYDSLGEVEPQARRELDKADLALFTSFCPDGPAVARWILASRAAVKAFYDLDTPVTLEAAGALKAAGSANGAGAADASDAGDRAGAGKAVAYLPSDGLGAFDLVLSFTGGKALDRLRSRLGARAVAAFYGWVDPQAHCPAARVEKFRGELSYLGTYAADRQRGLEELFVEPARRMPRGRFQLAGAQYPENFPWQPNIAFARHLDPSRHSAFLCSSRATLNVTRGVMAKYGYCPSGRLFEAAACGAPIVTDGWEGLEMFFAPGAEVLRVDSADAVLDALRLSDAELGRMAQAAQERVLARHTAARRAIELEALCELALRGARQLALAS